MKTKQFLEGIVPSEGVLVAATPKSWITPQGETKYYHEHTAVDNVSELTKTVLEHDRNGKDTFFALASFKEHSYVDAKGKTRVRTQDNVGYMRCFFMDIDCNGGDKNYDSQRDALLALHQFVKGTSLPKPSYIVNSGGGIHVYWTFTQNVELKHWQPVANHFKQLIQHFKIKADPVSADSARILRPIGTHNHKKKYKTPKPVSVLKATQAYEFKDVAKCVLTTCKKHNVTVRKTTTATPANNINSALGGGMDEFPPSDADKIAQKCNALKSMKESKGADQTELEWYNCLGILRHTEQGDDVCQDWSSQHPDYSAVATKEKTEQWGDLGPTMCDTMRSVCDACDGCTLKCSSPIVLGYPDPQHQTEIPVQVIDADEPEADGTPSISIPTQVVESLPSMPEELDGKFAWVETTGLMASVTDKEGNDMWVTICSQFPIPDFIFWDDVAESYMLRVKARVAPFKWLSGDIPMETVQKGGVNLIGALGAKCAITVVDDGKLLVKYMKTWVDSIRKNTELMSMCDQMGWQKDSSFLLGNKLYATDGTASDVVVSRSLTHYAAAHEPKGSFDRFVEIIDYLYNRPKYENYQFFWLASFASPLIKFVHAHNVGITLSAWSKDSGTGKTSVCKAGIANFGDPSGFGQTADGTEGATEYAMFTMAGLRHNLPILVDETTEWSPQKLGSFVYRFSNGTGKLQGKADGGLRDTAKLNWNSICYITSNTPCAQSLMAHKRNCQAQLARVFDVRFNSTNLSTDDSVLFEELWQHTGNTGARFMQYVTQNQEKVKALNAKYLSRINKLANLTQEARFWAMFSASVMTSAQITKLLGIHNFDVQAIEDWTVAHLKKMKVVSNATIEAVDDTLRDLMADLQSGMVVTLKEPTTRGEFTRFADGYGAPRSAVTGRYVVETGDVYIPVNLVRKWCAEQNVDVIDLRDKLHSKKWLKQKDIRYDVGRGTNVTSTRARCWHLNYEDAAHLLDVVPPVKQQG
jgi:hypothetical protein